MSNDHSSLSGPGSNATDRPGVLSPPHADRRVFKTNFIQTAVLELKYPTLLDFGESVPSSFAKILRQEFPKYRKVFTGTFSETGMTSGQPGFEFESRKTNAKTVNVNESSIRLQINEYKSFEEFVELAQLVHDATKSLLDTDFFTRVGYRIINQIKVPSHGQKLNEFINSDLLKPIDQSVMGPIIASKFEVRGKFDEQSSYLLKYGTPDNLTEKFDTQGNLNFMLDFDYSIEDLDIGDMLTSLQKFHDKHFDFFWWTLGDSAKQQLMDAK